MEFKSLEEIQKHFGITKESPDEIRKDLVTILADYHPDKTGGEYANKVQERNYEEINRAIEFIDESKKDTSITKHELSVILKKIEDLSIITSIKSAENNYEDKAIEKLDNTINESIIQFQKKHLFPKISSLAISGILTILWAFPSITLEHPILKNFNLTTDLTFTILWGFSLFLTGYIWLIIKIQEHKDVQLKKRFSFDSVQSSIFKLFICWTQIVNPRRKNYEDDKTITKFTKDELVHFILNHYNSLEREYKRELNRDSYSLYMLIKEDYKDKDISRIQSFNSPISRLFLKAGEIDIEFAQQVSENIINKLLKKGMIKTIKKQLLSDMYEYIEVE